MDAAKGREPEYIRTQCILSTTSPVPSTTSTVLEIEKLRLPSLEPNSNSTTDGSWKPPTSTTMTAVLDMEKLKLLSVDANSSLIAASRPWTYTGATGTSMEVSMFELEISLLKLKII